VLVRLATNLSRRSAAANATPNLERPRVPWLLVLAGAVVLANVAAAVLTLVGQ
jgi:hypothetical protein